MASLNHMVLGILILQIYVYAAPSDVSKLEDIAKVEHADTEAEQADPKLDSEPKEDESDKNSTETQRHKRWYNPYGFGFPPQPINPFINPGYNKRDEGPNTGYYGEDPLEQIHRRIQDLHRDIVRQPLPPPPPQIPIFFPVLFIPTADCNCNNENQNPTTLGPDSTVTPIDNNNDNSNDNGTTQTVIASRWPDMEDNRQNWGFVVNESDSEEGIDFNRPISFDPIRPSRPLRPPPPVEHGSVQGDIPNENRPQSEEPSAQAPPPRNPQSTTRRPPQTWPQSIQPTTPASGLAPPSRCDSAILSCCHQPQLVYSCFVNQGCPDLSGYGAGPCDPNLILRVIERFQTYYGQRYN